jgi:hypothetical protein
MQQKAFLKRTDLKSLSNFRTPCTSLVATVVKAVRTRAAIML